MVFLGSGTSGAVPVLLSPCSPAEGFIPLAGLLAGICPGECCRRFGKGEFDLHRPRRLVFLGEPRRQGETCHLIPPAQRLLASQNSPEVRLGHPQVLGQDGSRESLLAQKLTQPEWLHGRARPGLV
jgi:hypothetical protein